MTATTEVILVADADNETNDFRAWMKAMGFNAKQVGQAGELIGMASAMAGRTGRSERELTETERLAMSAATAGLPAWSPEAAAEIEAIRTLYTMLKREMDQAGAGSGAEVDAVKTTRALIRLSAIHLSAGILVTRLGSTPACLSA